MSVRFHLLTLPKLNSQLGVPLASFIVRRRVAQIHSSNVASSLNICTLLTADIHRASQTRFSHLTMTTEAASTLQYRSPLLLGATGRVGGLILENALAQQMHVTALVRDKSKLAPHPNLRIVQGSPLNQPDVEAAMAGCDSVISALANARTSDMLWAKQVSPDWFMRDSIRNVITAMRSHSLLRVVVVSSWGVAEDYLNTPWLFRVLVRYSTMHHPFADHGAVDADVKRSGLDWTLLRPVGFKAGDVDGWRVATHDSSVGVGLSQGMINRAVVASFALQALNDAALVHKTPVMTQEKVAPN